jgi:AcrR family transcriptional regulator
MFLFVYIPISDNLNIMDRREEILQACYELIADKGIKALSQPRIAAAVGLKQGHLTYYFPTRADLLKAVAQGVMNLALAPMEHPEPGVKLTRDLFVDGLVQQVCDPRRARFMVALTAMSEEDPAIHSLIREFDSQLIERVGAILALITEIAPIRAETLHAVVTGLSIQALTAGGNDQPILAKQVLMEVLRASK